MILTIDKFNAESDIPDYKYTSDSSLRTATVRYEPIGCQWVLKLRQGLHNKCLEGAELWVVKGELK